MHPLEGAFDVVLYLRYFGAAHRTDVLQEFIVEVREVIPRRSAQEPQKIVSVLPVPTYTDITNSGPCKHFEVIGRIYTS